LPFWNGIAHVVSSNRPPLTLSLFEAALEVRIEAIVGGSLDLIPDGSVLTNPLLGEGSVVAPGPSSYGVANDHEQGASSPLRASSSVANVYAG
jgi:hypothetical protein